MTRRAVGIGRNSPDEDRGGETKHTLDIQRQQVEEFCDRQGWQLVDWLLEEDISGAWNLERRPGLTRAIEMCEQDEADVVIVARFDRMVRSVKVQLEITERVERARGGGCDLYAVDSGAMTNGNATEKLSSRFLGLVSAYHSDTTRERTYEAMERAIANGIPLFAGATAGYLRPVIGHRPDGTAINGPLIPDPKTRGIVQQAWRLRASGATIKQCRAFLAEHGIDYTYPGVIKLFKSRLVLGELHHGKLVNLHAHEAIIDRDLWQRVQDLCVPRGRQAKSPRLLARLGVLRCATCHSRMSIGYDSAGTQIYRCDVTSDCTRRVTIKADTADEAVWQRALEVARDRRGWASQQEDAVAAEREALEAEKKMKGLVAMLTGLEDDIDGARTKILEAKAEAKRARARADRMSSQEGLVGFDPGNPQHLALIAGDLERRRKLITATVPRALVTPANGVYGAARLKFE